MHCSPVPPGPLCPPVAAFPSAPSLPRFALAGREGAGAKMPPVDRALAELHANASSQFDPQVVKALATVVARGAFERSA